MKRILALFLGLTAALSAQIVPTQNVRSLVNVAQLRTYGVAGVTTGQIVQTQGYYSANDGGNSNYVWNAASTSADNGGSVIQPSGITTGRWLLQQSSAMLNVRQFGAYGDNSHDDTSAFNTALATGTNIFVPFGIYRITNTLPLTSGGLIGAGWGTAGSAQRSTLMFYGLSSSTPAVTIWQSGTKGQPIQLENLYLLASSWDGSTGANGNGLDVEATCIVRNVAVVGFHGTGLSVHADAGNTGPYNSYFEGLYVVYSGQYGCQIGSGANEVTFVNSRFYWSGAPSYLVQPSALGSYDGFNATSTVGTWPNSTIENLTIIGGDASYNSRYGWALNAITNSVTTPGYAENNLAANDCFVGSSVSKSFINFAVAHNGVNNSASANTGTWVLLGGVPQPTGAQNYWNNWAAAASGQNMFQTDGSGNSIYYFTQKTPDGNSPSDVSLYGTLRGFGSWGIGIGSGNRFIKIEDNMIRLPDIWYQAADASGWNSGKLARAVGTAAPSGGTWAQGDIVYNTTPSAGGFIGWVCVSAGTPGTWKTFGVISP